MSVPAAISMTLFWAGAALLLYVYWGYGMLLKLLARRPRTGTANIGFDALSWPAVTVLLTVHNEERHIERRLQNLLEQNYPQDHFDIVVVSDGSTDATETLVEKMAQGRPIRLIRTARLGKSTAQNEAMRTITSAIVVFTDAEASFDRSCLREFAVAFAEPLVGCATAHLQIVGRAGAVSLSQGRYWSYELTLRALESRLGILAVASGQAMALRRSLFRQLPEHVGEDCIVPLDVVAQGYKVVHCPSALATDAMPDEHGSELRARIRMTLRNWGGTWLHPPLLNPLRHPGYAFALWSHKLLRWLGSVALVVMTLAAIALALQQAAPFVVGLMAAFWVAATLGFAGARRGLSIPVAGTIYSFVVANAGFLVGLSRWLLGHKVTHYEGA